MGTNPAPLRSAGRALVGFAVLAVSLPAVPFLAGCRGAAPDGASESKPTKTVFPWSNDFTPPMSLDTARVHLEPLQPKHVELDYAAFMGCREYLQKTLHWGSWPPADFTVDKNRKDLEGHWGDFEARRGYTYTVLVPDRSKCVGCVYIYPPDRRNFVGDPRAQLDYWVIESEIPGGLDEHLLRSVVAWLGKDFVFPKVYVPVHKDNERGMAVARAVGLPETNEWRERDADTVFLWRRG